MKIKYIVLAVLVLGIVGVSIWSAKDKTQVVEFRDYPAAETTDIPVSGQFCYSRVQAATDVAPYAVEEHVVLNFDGTTITGTKEGTQAGPDMTNGYQGTLVGAVIPNETMDEIELTYEYTVEGSQNRELELYTFAADKLVKERWALEEATINNQAMLVPDFKGDPTLITYEPEACK